MIPFGISFFAYPKVAINQKLSQARNARFRTFSSSPFSHACESGFWRYGTPDPATMRNGKWAGKGRSWAWAQVVEDSAQLRSAFSSRLNGAHDGWHHRHERAARPVPRGFCARFTAACDAAKQATGGPCAWAKSAREGMRGGGGAGGARDWRYGTGSGPFSWEAFERCFDRGHWPRAGRGWGERFWQDGHRRREKCRSQHHWIARRARFQHARLRAKAGLTYFLTTNGPHASPEWRGPSVLRPAFSQIPIASVPPPHTSSSSSSSHSSYFTPPHTPYQAGPYTFPLKTSVLGLPVTPFAPTTSLHARLFSTNVRPPRSECLEAGVPILLPLVTLLKSSAALNVISMISRVALTLLPLSARAKLQYYIIERYRQNPDAAGWIKRFIERSGGIDEGKMTGLRLNATYILPFLACLPLILLAATVVASYERTPVTGRPRIVMLSPDEEADLVDSVLSTGIIHQTGSRDWVTILRNVFGIDDEGLSSTTGRRIFLGGEVLDARDWRVRWTEAVLRALEAGVPALATRSPDLSSNEILAPPPNKYPLGPRPAHPSPSTSTEAHSTSNAPPFYAEYDLLVIDRQEPNAFSFGFGPDELDASVAGRRGVVVVYSGFISEILGESFVPTAPIPRSTPQMASLFGNLFSSRASSVEESLPNLVPTTLPTPAQTKSLAVLLSHELAHLVLSHTLESYASTSLLLPHISKMFSDVVRTFLYPVTLILGPFVNDAIGRSMNQGAQETFGIFGQAVNSCNSRKLEDEADLVALRLLALSGIDPRFALDFWEGRLSASSQPPTALTTTPSEPLPNSHLLRLHSKTIDAHGHSPGETSTLLNTHPINEDRIQRIKDELDKWIAYNELRASH